MMKKITLLSMFVVLIFSMSHGQTSRFGINDFDSIQNAFYQNYTGSGEDSTEAGNFRQFQRWERFWGPRVMSFNNLDSAYAYYKDYVDDFDPTDQESLLVDSDWEEIGPKENGLDGIGRVDAIAFHPTDTNTIFLGCPSGGVWKTTDGGQNWQNLNTDYQLPSLGVSSIAVDPSDPDTIFLGTGDVDSEYTYSCGIYRTTDGGDTWHEAGLNDSDDHFTIGKVILHPQIDSIAFAATSLGIYKTTNRHNSSPTWAKVYPAATNTFEYIRNICFHPSNPDTLYATGIDIVSSTQNGNVNTWNRIATSQNGLDFANTPYPNALGGDEYVLSLNLAIAPQGDYLYVNCVSRDGPPPHNWQSNTYYHVFKYDIINDYWYNLSTTGLTYGITAGRTEMAVYPQDSRYVYSGGVFLRLFNPLASPNPKWESVTFPAHMDYHELVFSPHDSTVLYAGTDGGFYKGVMTSSYTSFSTTELNNGLGIATAYNLGSSRIDPDQILTGYQDCGISYLKNDSWSHEITSDGFQCLMDEDDIDLMYATTYAAGNGTLHRSSNSCLNPSWSIIMEDDTPINEQAWFGASLVADPSDNNTLFQARLNLWKVDDASTASLSNWYKITDVSGLTSSHFGANNCVSFALEIAPSDPDYIYFTGVKIDAWATDFDAVRVLKTSVGGGTSTANWTDITPTPDPGQLGTYFVTDIAVSSWDPNKIWITYSGYREDHKLKYYNGTSWSDFDNGLPNIPMNCIMYANGSNDALVVGTDVGAYYRDATMNRWEPFMENLPNVIVSWLELNYTNQKLRAGTFGRGLWETDFPSCDKNTDTISITSDITWIEPQIITNDLIVESGVTLTIESTVYFAEDCKLIIKPNGKVELDGGTLTSECTNQWQGIEVWGNPSATQTAANQGTLEIINGGTIEYAEVAVRVGSEDHSNYGGGIVEATNGNFNDNGIGVWFDPYSYTTNNASGFTNCKFDYTLTLNGEATFTHAKLNDVHHVDFAKCEFTNNSNYDHRGYGIYSTNSIFNVEGDCATYSGTDCIEWDYGIFENLDYGIYATASNTTDLADIRHTKFIENHHGIYLSGMTLPRITSDSLFIDKTATQEGYGLYLDACTQYWVEDNYFEGTGTSLPTGIGVYVNESGDDANEIYLNSFDYVEYAVIAKGENRDDRRPETGLEILCNDYDNTDFDETIIYDGTNDPPEAYEGIASLQGNNATGVLDMAGNLFYYNTTVAGDFDDINNESNHFYYYYSNNATGYDVEPLDYTSSTVTKVPVTTLTWTYSAGCPSGISTGGGGGGTEGSRSAMAGAQADIENTEAVLAALVDGGDTESLNNEVESSTPPEAAQVYNELMAESPMLSETVVESTIEKEEVIPNAMLRDVMVANPHTATSLQLLDMLDHRDNPMPAYMKAQILAGRSITSLKAELEGQLAVHTKRKAKAMNQIARYFGNMPQDDDATDSLLALYQADNSLSSHYMQAWLHLHAGGYLQGQNVMADIATTFTPTGAELEEYQNMLQLYTMLKGLYMSGNNIGALSGAQQTQLHSMVNAQTGFASVYARNILLALDASDYKEPVVLPNRLKSAVAEEAYNEVLNTPVPKMLEVYPNPSKDFVILGYLFDKETQGMIEIRDISGTLMQSIPFNGMQDQLTVVTTNWTPGIYMLSLVVGDKVVETTKFTFVN